MNMRISLFAAGLIAAVAAWPVSGNAVTVTDLAEACQDGNQRACSSLMSIARQACLQGDDDGCQVAAQLGGRPRYDRGTSTYSGDVLAPHRGIIRGTNDYINSYCNNSRMRSQLQAFNYCR